MKRLSVIAALAAAAAMPAAAGEPDIAPADSVSTAVGTVLGDYIRHSVDQLASLGVKVDTDVFIRAMDSMLRNRPTGFTVDDANQWLDSYIRSTRPDDLPEAYTPESQAAFVAEAAATPAAVTTPSGLVFIVEREGEGPMPAATDKVEVMYTGRFYDGTVFDATGSPITFGVTEVTPGFSEGLRMMRPGGRYRLVMPASLAYGTEGIPGAIPGNAALDFTVDLIKIN